MDAVPAHPEFEPFWQALRARRICFPRCEACGKHHWYPMKRCPACLGREIRWAPVDGPGAVYSWTTVHHAFDPAWVDELPYVVALVEFEDAPGIRLVTNLVDLDDAPPWIGMPVVPCYDRLLREREPGVHGRWRIRFRPG